MDRGMKLLVLGRDGVINAFRDEHVGSPAEWEPLPGALEAIARLNHAGWHVVVATNQPGLARGLIDMAGLNAVHLHMNELLAHHGGRIDAVFLCPHAPEDGCDCRKPAPGLLQRISERFQVPLAQLPFAGDTLRDLLAAQAAGCQPHLLLTGRGAHLVDEEVQAMVHRVPGTRVHADLSALADALIVQAEDALAQERAARAGSP